MEEENRIKHRKNKQTKKLNRYFLEINYCLDLQQGLWIKENGW